MIDLTKIDKPFGELDRETKIALITAVIVDKQPCGISPDGESFELCINTTFLALRYYRLAPRKTVFDWSQAAPEFKYLYRDRDGDDYLHTETPTVDDDEWCSNDYYIRAEVFASYVKGDEDWASFRMDRPE